MTSFLKNFLDTAKRSLWLIPFMMAICGLILSVVFNQLDFLLRETRSPFYIGMGHVDVEGVRELFSNISGSLITVMTTILAITLLIFTVLAGQFGAYILRVFKVKTFSKFILGWFAGTYIYIIYNIYVMSTSGDDFDVPKISIVIGVLLTVITIFLILLYIHFLVRQIQASTVISEISEELNRSIRSLQNADEEVQIQAKFSTEKLADSALRVKVQSPGYIQNVDKDSLAKIAKKNNCVIKILYRAGEFITTGSCGLIVYSNENLDKDLISDMGDCFITGEKRIPIEDIECNLNLLLEIALRGLSPGINDLMIANNCIDYIAESVALLLPKKFPENKVYSEDGKLLLISKEFTIKGYFEAAFNMLRQYGYSHCSVTLRIMDRYISLVQLTEKEEYKLLIAEHFNAIFESAIDVHQQSIDQLSLYERKKVFQSFIEETSLS
ncbi:MAG: DUF2254 domain-containing protein [Waddliaceae bacterium]